MFNRKNYIKYIEYQFNKFNTAMYYKTKDKKYMQYNFI